MMKRLLFSIAGTFLLMQFAAAQKLTPCGYIIPPRSLTTKFQSVYEAKEIVNHMLDTIKWKENFNLREQNGIQNAYATIMGGRRWIVYDNNFLEDIDEYAKTKWASLSIMAHEMGHHYYNHVVSGQGSTIPSEIEADAFSGYMMNRMGASLDQALAAMRAVGSDRASNTHPAKSDRLAAITRGWNAAKTSNNPGSANSGSNTGTTTPAPTPTPTNPNPYPTNPNPTNPGNPNTPQTSPDNDPSWIALTIQSNRDETVQLSDDGRKFQPAEIKAGQAFVFKFEIYNYGWLKLPYYNGYRTYKLMHGKDYHILYSRRSKNWTVVEIPE